MFINQKFGEIHLKIVYYGPAMSGKTSNLVYIHGHTNPQMRSQLVSLKTREDRTIFFDYLQLELGRIKGLKPKFSLYTVPGQVYYAVSRKLVLEGADGVVFVADSQPHRLPENQRDLASLEQYMAHTGCAWKDFPMVLQCNKQDMPGALSPEVIKSQLGKNQVPCFSASAQTGNGVFDTLKAIISQVARAL
jgi:signal recognition particle receptor subunit beta